MPRSLITMAAALTAVATPLVTAAPTATADGHPAHRPTSVQATRPGVCTLGIDLGHWAPNGDAARICRTIYGT